MGRFLDWWLGESEVSKFNKREDVPGPSDPSIALQIPSRATLPRSVSARDAIGLVSVYRAVEIRAVAAKQISLDAVKAGRVIEGNPHAILRRPDPLCSRSQFIEKTVVSLDLAGNAYFRIERNRRDEISSVWVMNPHDVVIDVARSGRVKGYRYQGETLSADEVKHLARLRVPGSPYGLGPIQAAQVELRGSLDTAQYGSDFLDSGSVPTGILKSDQILDPNQAKLARTQWEESQGGRRGIAVLGQGLDYRQTFLSPKDAQFIESQNWGVAQAARLFGVPGSLMLVFQEGQGQTYQNVEQDWLGFVRFGLMNDLIEIEDAFSDFLPYGTRAKCNVEGLLRADTKSRYEAHNLALTGGWRTINEVRDIEGLDPLPERAPEAPPRPTPVEANAA